MFSRHSLALVFLYCISVTFGKGIASEPVYSFWVVPQYKPAQLHKDWYPLLETISQQTGIKLELRLLDNIPEFEKNLLSAQPDFAYANPYHAVMAKKSHDYMPIIRDSSMLSGILVVRDDSPYQSINDLTGKKIGFPSPNAFGASLYMRALLTEKFGIKYQPVYLTTHANVFRNVAHNQVDAGGAIIATLLDTPDALKAQLRELYRTPETASHPVITHPRVPQDAVNKLRAAFLSLQNTEEGLSLLRNIRVPKPVIADYDNDYAAIEALNLEKYVLQN